MRFNCKAQQAQTRKSDRYSYSCGRTEGTSEVLAEARTGQALCPMALSQGNKPATSRCRQFCLQARHTRQRAPFSSGLHTQRKTRRHCIKVSPPCCALTVETLQPALQHSAVQDSQPFSFSTYRNDGALSEVSIADCLCQEAFQTQAGLKQAHYLASHRSIQSSANSTAAAPHAAQVTQICVTYSDVCTR